MARAKPFGYQHDRHDAHHASGQLCEQKRHELPPYMMQLIKERQPKGYDGRLEPEFNHVAAFIITFITDAAHAQQRDQRCNSNQHRAKPCLAALTLYPSRTPIDEKGGDGEGQRIA